jgi:glyoxylase-like metal-dependent hydrolase (beta-lactamase superfamily II)
VEIAPGIQSLSQKKGGRVHAFLVDDGNGLTLVDTLYDSDADRVLEAISGIGRQVSDLQNIVLTHGHRSHLGGARALREQSGATVHAHEWEADIVAGERKAQPVSLVPQKPLRAYFPLQIGLALGLGKHPPCPVDQHVSDGDRIGPLEVFHAPGHSPGHLVFYWSERQVLFAGDAIATWPEFSAGGPPSTSTPSSIATRSGEWRSSTATSSPSGTASPFARTAAVTCATSRTHSSATPSEREITWPDQGASRGS